MSAEILDFPKSARQPPKPGAAHMWADHHLPLIDSAMDLLQADDREFRQRCRTIAATEGPTVLDQLAVQLDRLNAHLAGLVANLSMVAKRIRRVVASGGLEA